MTLKNKPNEIYINRLYDAPVKMVWDAWTDLEQVSKWWGPRGFSITTKSKDLKPGGKWIYTMHGPDGVDYPNVTTYFEVEKYSRLVYDHGANENQDALFKVTVTFKEEKGKTLMEMTMALATAEAAQEIKKFIKQAGGDATWDRLAEYLAPRDSFVINRTFDAPIHTMFDAWTDTKHLSKWLPPTGFTASYHKSDIRPGGSAHYCMTNGNDVTMYGKAFYKEIERPTKLVYTQIFCDKDENVSRHPMAPTWPETMLTTVLFAEEEANKTRVTITWEVYGEATEIERETFKNAKAGMTMGWTGSFDKLEDYLSSL